MRVTLIHNPTAGDEEHGRKALLEVLEDAGHDVVYQSVKKSGWKEALDEPAELVVAAGGDGTVRKVFKELAGTDVPATLFPLGSANNIARTLGFGDTDPARLARGWQDARRRPFDVGRVESPSGDREFVETMGGGVFAALLERAEDADDDPNSADEKVELGLRLLRNAIEEASPSRWEVDLDGTELSGELLAVEAMNVGETGPNVPLAPDADPGDGLLDVVLLRPPLRPTLAAYVEARLHGRPAHPPQLERVRGRRLTMDVPAGCPLRVDDKLVPPEENGASVASVGDLRVEVLVPS